jgi:hypothetical protein
MDNFELPLQEPSEDAAAETETVNTAPVETIDPANRRDVIKQAMESRRGLHAANQHREKGRFAESPLHPQLPGAAAAIERAAMPKSLKREYQKHWNNAPAELTQAIAQRDADYEKGINMFRDRADEAGKVLEQFRPYEWLLKNENTTPEAAIGPLLQTAALLRTGSAAQKAHAVAQMIQQFGIPLDAVYGMLNPNTRQQPNNSAQQQSAHYDQLSEQINQIQQNMQQREAYEQESRQQKSLTVIEEFSKSAPHFDAVQDRMVLLLKQSELLGDITGLTERDKLQRAYDTAVRMDSTIHSQAMAQQQASLSAVKQARTAAVSVKGAPASMVSNGTVSPNDRRAVIANALRRYS